MNEEIPRRRWSTSWDAIFGQTGGVGPNGEPLPALPRRAGAFRETAVLVGTRPVELPSPRSDTRRKLIMQNLGSASIYLGSATVAVGSGLELQPGDVYELILEDTLGRQIDVAVYAISGTAGQDVRAVEVG